MVSSPRSSRLTRSRRHQLRENPHRAVVVDESQDFHLFDRSWYNRAGVEHVMGFCTPEEYTSSLRSCPEFELSEMDLQGRDNWVEFSKAKDEMFNHTDIKQAPWYTVEGDDKRRARLNFIAHILSMVPYEDATPPPLKLPPRGPSDESYVRPPKSDQNIVPDLERLSEPAQRAARAGFVQPLAAAPPALQAALLLKVDETRLSEELAAWQDLRGEELCLHLGDAKYPANLLTCRPEDRCIGTSHWVQFVFDSRGRQLLGEFDLPAHFGVQRSNYRQDSPLLSEEVRQSLLDDLQMSDRDG